MDRKGVARERVRGELRRSGEVQSLVRALTIINTLAETAEGATLTQIARRVGLSSSTVHRLLTTLEQEHYVRFQTEGRLWAVGVQAFVAGGAFARSRELARIARPIMCGLMEASGEAVGLAMVDDCEAIYVTQMCPRAARSCTGRQGQRVPLHCSSVGRALLSAMPVSEASRIVRHGCRSDGPLEVDSLFEDIRRVGERGFAVGNDEDAPGQRCVAAVIFNEFMEPIGALSVSGPRERIRDGRVAELGALVYRAANIISRHFGGRVPANRIMSAIPRQFRAVSGQNQLLFDMPTKDAAIS